MSGKPSFVLVVPTLVARNLVFRMLNSVRSSRSFEMVIDYSSHLSVGEKFNGGIDAMMSLGVPAIFANDDIVLWPEALDILLDKMEEGCPFVAGSTTTNMPGEEEPCVGSTGGFSLFGMTPGLVTAMSEWESEHWDGYATWDSYAPGRFDGNFRPGYYEDKDFFYRMKLCGVQEHVCTNALFYHELTRGEGGKVFVGAVTSMSDRDMWRRHKKRLSENLKRYERKWGGTPDQETFCLPWGGQAVSQE